MKSKILEAQKNQYLAQFEKFGDSPKATFQNDHQTQSLRFSRLVRPFLPLKDQVSIHDVGSGLCDFHQYLLDQKISHNYSGTEIVPEFISRSQEKFPAVKIYQRDFADDSFDDEYDFVVLSGTLNLRCDLDEKTWQAYIQKLLIRMFRHARRAISFNFLTTYNTFNAPDLFYFDPKELFDFCQKNLSRFVSLDHGYPLYEATIAVFKPGEIQSRYEGPAFEKYFPKKK